MITAEVSAPTIGIGAGPECDGQVLVFHDILNLTFGPPAKFVRRYGDAAAMITNAVQAYRADVRSHQYPADSESYHLPKDTKAGLDTVLASGSGRWGGNGNLPQIHADKAGTCGRPRAYLSAGTGSHWRDCKPNPGSARLVEEGHHDASSVFLFPVLWLGLRDVFSAVDRCLGPEASGIFWPSSS